MRPGGCPSQGSVKANRLSSQTLYRSACRSAPSAFAGVVVFKVVNGFVCTSGCDEHLAKKNIDPRNPRNDPVKQEQLDQNDPSKFIEKVIEEAQEAGLEARRNPHDLHGPAVVLGGSLSDRGGGSAGQSAPEPQSVTGARLNIVV